MGRSQRNVRLGGGKIRGAGPKEVGSTKADVTRKSGRERPDPATANPPDLADPQARVIKTRS